MRKHKLKTSVCAVASTSLLLLSATAFNAAAEEEVASNFLSVPAIFAEGYGLSGLLISDDHDAGLPEAIPSDDWTCPYYYLGTAFYLQANISNSWQADWTKGADMVDVTVDWSDEVISKAWNDKSVIPVSVTLHTPNGQNMNGYKMTSFDPADLVAECPDSEDSALDQSLFLTSEEESEEIDLVWGTTPSSYGLHYGEATVFTVCAQLTIKRIEDENGLPVDEVWLNEEKGTITTSFEKLGKPVWLLPSIDVEGRIVYLYNWNIAQMQGGPTVNRSGWYRLTFKILDQVTYELGKGYSVEDRGEHTVKRKVNILSVAPEDIELTDGKEEYVIIPEDYDLDPEVIKAYGEDENGYRYVTVDIYITDVMGE